MARFLFYDDKLINILLKEEKPSGGAAVQAYGWITGLEEIGHEVFVLTNTYAREDLKEECKSLSIIPMYDSKKGIRWIRWIYYRLPHLYKEIKKIKPDYLYQGVPGWQSFLIGMICKILKVKYLQRISNDYLLDERFYKNNSKTHHYFMRLGMRMSFCILCQNDYQYNSVKRYLPGKKAIKIGNPIVLSLLRKNHSRTGIKYIAWIGLFQYQKNLQLLYEIASSLASEQFFIAGKEEKNCDAETRNYVRKLQALPNVKYVGFLERKEVLPFLTKAKFLLNTSHYEGFSNTFLEAMSVGIPIISSSKVNPDNIISKHHLGIIYNDLQDFMQKYQKLDYLAYEKMSLNVLDYVPQHHNYKNQANKLLAFLDARE